MRMTRRELSCARLDSHRRGRDNVGYELSLARIIGRPRRSSPRYRVGCAATLPRFGYVIDTRLTPAGVRRNLLYAAKLDVSIGGGNDPRGSSNDAAAAAAAAAVAALRSLGTKV